MEINHQTEHEIIREKRNKKRKTIVIMQKVGIVAAIVALIAGGIYGYNQIPSVKVDKCISQANEFEEGTGHHSMIKENGQWYAVYHARDYDNDLNASAFDARNARICKMHVKDGIITAERYKDHI